MQIQVQKLEKEILENLRKVKI